MSIFAQRLKRLRKERELTQIDLAKVIGQSKDAVASWETDRNIPNTDSIKKLMDYFDVSEDCLTGKSCFRNQEDVDGIACWEEDEETVDAIAEIVSHLSQAGMLAIHAHATELLGIETRQKKREEEVASKE